MSFIVRYPGAVCVECDQEIKPGTEAAYVGENELAHTLCPDTTAGLWPKETCPRCFMVKSVNGSCGCD